MLYLHPETRIAEVDGVIAIGTIFPLGDVSLNSALASLRISWKGLDDLSGRFAVLVEKNGGFEVANDAFGARSVFYSTAKKAIASHSTLLGEAFGIGPQATVTDWVKAPEYKERVVKYLPGDLTMFDNVYALIPNHFLTVAIEQKRYWPIEPLAHTTMDQFLAAAHFYLDSLSDYLAGESPLFGITAGIDSRAVFAALLARGVHFEGVTWKAPYLKSEEVPVVQQIVEVCGMPHRFIHPRNSPKVEIAQAAQRWSGGYRAPALLTAGMTEFPQHYTFIRGVGGEILRGFYNTKRPMPQMTPDQMAMRFGVGPRSASYAKTATALFAEFLERGDYDKIVPLGYDPADFFYWEHRMGMWGAATLTEFDPAMDSLAGFNSRPLYAIAFGLPKESRLTKDLLKTVVQSYSPALAAVTVL